MFKKHFLPLVFILFGALLLGSAANALNIGMPSEITLSDRLVEMPITLTNDSSSDLHIDLNASAVGVRFELPESIDLKANETETIQIKLHPLGGFQGQKYNGIIYFKQSTGSLIKKDFKIAFIESNECPASIDLSHELVTENGVQLIKLDLSAENNSAINSITVGIDSIKTNYEDIEFHPNAVLALGPLEEGKATYYFRPVYDELSISLKCNDWTVEKKINSSQDSNYFASGIGLVSLGGVNSFLLDIGLAIIVILLLIAFIARLVKKFSKKQVVE